MRLTVSTARPTMARDERDVKRQSHRPSVRHFSVAGVARLRRTAAHRCGPRHNRTNSSGGPTVGLSLQRRGPHLPRRVNPDAGRRGQGLRRPILRPLDYLRALGTSPARVPLFDLGCRVPQDLSLAGVDDIPSAQDDPRAHHGASADGRNGPAGVRLGGAWRPCRARAGHQRRPELVIRESCAAPRSQPSKTEGERRER